MNPAAGHDPVAQAFRGEGPLFEAMLDDRTRRLAEPEVKQLIGAAPVLLCAGRVCRYALPLAAVRAVLPLPKIAEVPGVSPHILGLALLLGERHLVIDLARLGGEEPNEPVGQNGYAVALRDAPVALAVAQALDIQSEPETMPAATSNLVRGIARDGTLLLDTEKLIARVMGEKYG